MRTIAKCKSTRTRKSLEVAVRNRLLQKTIQNRYGLFKNAWDYVQTCHDNYITTLTDDTVDEAWIDKLHSIFDKVEVETDEYLNMVEKQSISEQRKEIQLKADVSEKPR